MKNREEQTSFFYLPLASNIQTKSLNRIEKIYSSFFSKIGGEKIKKEQLLKAKGKKPILFFVLTGGTERKILRLWESISETKQKKIILVSHPNNNSLPAALETLARIQQEEGDGEIVYISNPDDSEASRKINTFVKNYYLHRRLDSTRIGLIGNPSDWLVASSPDPKTVEKVWGAEVKKISLEKIYQIYKNIPDHKADLELKKIDSLPSGLSPKRKNEFIKAIKIYIALKNIIAQENLDAITVRCFDFIIEEKVTGCLALALLNSEGIVAGCESDLISTLGMLWGYYLLHKKTWMANPSRINPKTNSILLAHCTISLDLVKKLYFPTHFESAMSVGIKGKFSQDDVTLLRIGGKHLNNLWIAEGKIIENTNHNNLCRTQVKVKLNHKARLQQLLENPLGNHLVLVKGRHKSQFLDAWHSLLD